MDFSDITSFTDKFVLGFKRFQFGAKPQLAFLEDFYQLINDGIPANRAIEMMAQAATGLTKDVALSIAQKVSEGQPLAEGMRLWFAPNIVEIIRVGEEGGALNETVKSAANTLGQRTGVLGAVIAAISYPILVIIMGCGVIVYLDKSVLIQFKAIKPIDQWPQAGRDLENAAIFIQEWWWLVIALIVIAIFGIRRIMNNYIGEYRPILDKFPPFSLYRKLAAARLMETMGLLVANGVVFKSAIKVMQYQANPYVGSHLVMMEHLMSMGRGNLADVLSTGLIDDASILRLRIMAEVKGFEHGLVRMGIRGSDEANKTLKWVAKLAGGLLLAVGALLIMIIIRGIYLTGMTMGSSGG